MMMGRRRVMTQTMTVFKPLKNITHLEWLEYRRNGIGGSDAGIILGLNKYKTSFELWLDKTGQVIPKETDSEAAYWGNQMEEVVAKEFERRTGKKVRRSNMMYQHPKYDFILANIDRFVVGESAILECKTASAYLAKEWEADEVPATYLVQVQHYLAVTGKEKAYIAVLIGGNKFIWKEIKRDDELIKQIIAYEIDFWETYVLGNQQPVLDGSSSAEKYLKERFSRAKEGSVITLNKDYNERLNYRAQLEKDIKQLTEQKKQIENKIKNEMETNETALTTDYRITWKNVTSNRIDAKKLKEKFPEVYKNVLKESNSRRFEIKEMD